MHYLYLAIAICAEVTATSFMKASDGFTKVVPTAVTIGGFCVALFFLSLTLKTIPTGIAYAIWSGCGVVLIATVAWIFQGQRLDVPAILGMTLIVSGVVIMNLFSKAASH